MRRSEVRPPLSGRVFISALGVAQICSWGSLYYAFPLIAEQIEREIGWTRTSLYGAASVGLLLTALASFPIGRAIDRGHGRLIMTGGSVLAGCLLLAWSQVNDLLGLYAILGLLGALQAATLYEPAFAVIARRFGAAQARSAITALTLWGGFASTVFIPLIQILIDTSGWRGALVTLGVINLTVCAVLYWAVIQPHADVAHADTLSDGQANVRGRDLGGFVTEARQKVTAGVAPPSAGWFDWGGQFENLERASARLALIVPLVFLLIGVLLFLALGSMAEAALVFAGVPLALVGGALALLMRGMPFSISAAVGFIAVSGVATLNGLVLMQAIKQYRSEGMAAAEAAVAGATSRLRAVLTTALVAILGFIPMALAFGPGAEVQKPLATVVIGGLITATLLTLLVIPTFAARLRNAAVSEHRE